jgi:uncharacterized protein (DUF362 family)
MLTQSTSVALLECRNYESGEISDGIDQLCQAVGFRVSRGSRVLLKPNLLTGRSGGNLACTHPLFVAAAAEWFTAQGAKVAIGDSPAFGTAKGVMQITGIGDAIAGLPVERINFDRTTQVRLSEKFTVNLASAALECDILVNLPRVKAHSQFYMTLAVKNYFGTVVGFQKPWWHLRFGNHAEQFAIHLLDLLQVLPAGITLLDGIVAMDGTGPVSGQPHSLGLIAGSINPVALDTAVLKLLGLELSKSILWQESNRLGLAGSDPEQLEYPLAGPEDFPVRDFKVPPMLKSVSFNPIRMFVSGCRRMTVRFKESS